MEPFNWSEDHIQKQLKQLPQFKDRRPKEAIFQQLECKINQPNKKVNRIKAWGIPALATACAAVLIVILVSGVWPNQPLDNMGHSGSAYHQKSIRITNMSVLSQRKIHTRVKEKGYVKKHHSQTVGIQETYHGPLTQQALSKMGKGFVTVTFMDDRANLLVPVSFLVTPKGTYADQVKQVLKYYHPEKAGLAPSALAKAEISESKGELTLNLKPNAIFEGEEGLFNKMLSMTFANNNEYSHIHLMTNGKKGYDFANLGNKESMDLSVHGAPFYKFISSKKQEFLVSLYGTAAQEEQLTFSEALKKMALRPDFGLLPILPVHMPLTVKESSGMTTISFPAGTHLKDNKESKKIIDAILITARSFGKMKILFENTGSKQIGPYQMDQPIEGVVGINFIDGK